jgi:hypothetical protein
MSNTEKLYAIYLETYGYVRTSTPLSSALREFTIRERCAWALAIEDASDKVDLRPWGEFLDQIDELCSDPERKGGESE